MSVANEPKRKTIDEKIRILVPLKPATYVQDFTWADLMLADVKPTDRFVDLIWLSETESGAFSLKMEDELLTYRTLYVEVIRPRPETDAEFLLRHKLEQTKLFETNERERLEYLRLKAKFEP